MIPTVQQFVDKNKVVLDVVFGDFSEVRLHDVDHLYEEFKDHRGVQVLLRSRREPHVRSLDVEEACSGDVRDGRPNLLPCVDNVDPEGIDSIATRRKT